MIFFDDMSDDAKLHDSHGLIAEIFLRRRHNYIQAVCGSQKWRSISTAVRGQTCWVCIFGLRSAEEKKAVLQEISAVYPLKNWKNFMILPLTKDSASYMSICWHLAKKTCFLRHLNTGCNHNFCYT